MDRRGKFCEGKRPEHPESAVVVVGGGQCAHLAPPTGSSVITKPGRKA